MLTIPKSGSFYDFFIFICWYYLFFIVTLFKLLKTSFHSTNYRLKVHELLKVTRKDFKVGTGVCFDLRLVLITEICTSTSSEKRDCKKLITSVTPATDLYKMFSLVKSTFKYYYWNCFKHDVITIKKKKQRTRSVS